MPVTRTLSEFNGEVIFAIKSSVFGLMGDQVLKAVFAHIKKHYDVTADEIPDRLDTLLATLEETFGVVGTKTIGKAIAKRFYFRMGLEFIDISTYSLQDYLEHAKKQLLHQQDTSANEERKTRRKSVSRLDYLGDNERYRNEL